MDSISLSTGSKLAGRYRVLQKLGEGSFAETFLAEDEHLPDAFRCVIKKLKTGVEDESKLQIAKRLFDSEARILHQLGSHGQIPQLLAHFEEDSEFYLVEEYVEGTSLYYELATGQQWSEGYVTNLLQDMLGVLKFVHQKQAIHRDIKPSNIIRRDSDGRVVLIDFGAVKQVTNQVLDDSSAAPHTVIVGTPGYMPGEQLRGSPRMSSDVYAVGMIALYALTGLNPALGELPEDEETAEILWRDRATISPELATILDKMVAYDFRQRYPSAAEALDAVHALALHRQEDAPTILKEASGPIGVPSAILSGDSGVGGSKSGSSGITINPIASGSSQGGIIINPSATGGSGIQRDHTNSLSATPSNSTLDQTSISPIEQSSMGTYAVADISPERISRATASGPSAHKGRWVRPKILALSGIALAGLGTIAALASPNIEPICKALNNCSAEVKYNAIYETAQGNAESALTAMGNATSLKDLEKAKTQLQESIQQLTKIPEAVDRYQDAKKMLPNYQKQLKTLDEKIAIEKKAQQDLQQAEAIANKVLTQKKKPVSVAELSNNKAQLQQALDRIKKIPDKSLAATQRQTIKQTYTQRVNTLDAEINKQAAIEAQQAARAYRAPAYSSGGGSSAGSGSRYVPPAADYTPANREPLWDDGGSAADPPPANWGGSNSTASQAPPPEPAAPEPAAPAEPLWGDSGGGGGGAEAPPPSQEPLF